MVLIRIVFIAFVVSAQCTNAQNVANTWLFGKQASLVFVSGGTVQAGKWFDSSYAAPGILYSGDGKPILLMLEKKCVTADNQKLEADSVRTKLRNAPRQPYNIPQSMLVRLPGSEDIIYSLQSHQNAGGGPIENGSFSLHIIDLKGNANRGSVFWLADTVINAFTITSTSHTSTRRNVAACQSLVPHPNGRDLWLLVPMVWPQQIWAMPITKDGIDSNDAIRSPCGYQRGFLSYPQEDATSDYIGEFKVSTDAKQVAVVGGLRGRIALYDFDVVTGLLTNEREISPDRYKKDSLDKYGLLEYLDGPYGIEFSPDSKKLYVTYIQYNGIGAYLYTENFNPDSARGELVQFDITLPTADAIRNSITTIVPMSYENRFGGLQLAPNGKIYIAQRGHSFVSSIDNPNAAGAACGFNRAAVLLQDGTRCGEGFPFIMATSLGSKLRVLSQDVCLGEEMLIPLAGGFITDSIRWHYGESGVADSVGFGRAGRHTYRTEGVYFVSATMYVGSEAQEPVGTWVYVHPKPNATASIAPATVCDGDSITLASTGGVAATWYLGSVITDSAIVGVGNILRVVAKLPGVYTVVVRSLYGCLDTTTANVTILPKPLVSTPNDTVVCQGARVTLTGLVANAISFGWESAPLDPSMQITSDGQQASVTFIADVARIYTLIATGANGCVTANPVRVGIRPLPLVQAFGDTIICYPSVVYLRARGARTYEWFVGSERLGIDSVVDATVYASGWVYVRGMDSTGCANLDSVMVTLRPEIDLWITGDTLLCDDAPVTITCNGAPAELEQELTWVDRNGVLLGKGKTLNVAPTSITEYRVALPAKTTCNDTARLLVRVGKRPFLTLTPTDTTVCRGETVRLTASTGETFDVSTAGGSTNYTHALADSVGCETQARSVIHAMQAQSLVIRFRDTTVEVGRVTQQFALHVETTPDLQGAQFGRVALMVTHPTAALDILRFWDATTSAPLVPVAVTKNALQTTFELSIPSVAIRSPSQPLIGFEALPLVAADTVSVIQSELVSLALLDDCIDTTAKSGLLTVTGCGIRYRRGAIIGSETSVTVRPNPASDAATISIEAGYQGTFDVKLVNMLGETVATATQTRGDAARERKDVIFDLTSLGTGLYNVVVATPWNQIVQPLVKQ